MDYPQDFWVLRDTPISDAELARLQQPPTNLEPAGSTFGLIPDGRFVAISGDGLHRWKQPGGGSDVLVALSSEGIHIADGGAVARGLANSIASVVGGWVKES